jgi:hypothetical protein
MSASGAAFSKCRRWRYLLWRSWDEKRPAANFLMLNPSTADEVKLDPSCTRARDPVGRGNDRAILRAARESAIVVCAWGNHGSHLERAVQVRRILNGIPLHALHMNRSGEPAHPLYLSGALRPRRWTLSEPAS